MKNASLVIVGTGIKFLSHITVETNAYLEQSDKVLFLVNDPAMKEWIMKINPNSQSLDFLYTKYPLRKDCYQAITEYILTELRKMQHLCVVLYGHPSVFAQPGLNAVKIAKKEGFTAHVLPGISAEDCLFADLLVDPGSRGCHSFETTDFLLYKRKFDPRSHLILWQVDIIGVLNNPQTHDNTQGATILVKYLSEFYPLDHTVTLYEAAQYPTFSPCLQHFPLEQLPQANFSRICTLYVPPLPEERYDINMLNELNLKLSDL